MTQPLPPYAGGPSIPGQPNAGHVPPSPTAPLPTAPIGTAPLPGGTAPLPGGTAPLPPGGTASPPPSGPPAPLGWTPAQYSPAPYPAPLPVGGHPAPPLPRPAPGPVPIRGGRQFAFDGGAATYIGTGLLALLVTVCTLGICYPFALVLRERWRAKLSLIDGHRLRFVGSAWGLFGHWIKWFALFVVTLGIYGFWIGPRIARWRWENTTFALPVHAERHG